MSELALVELTRLVDANLQLLSPAVAFTKVNLNFLLKGSGEFLPELQSQGSEGLVWQLCAGDFISGEMNGPCLLTAFKGFFSSILSFALPLFAFTYILGVTSC